MASCFVPQATLRYISQWDTSYDETGSVQNQQVDAHTTGIVQGRALMEAHFEEMDESDDLFVPSLRIGAQCQSYVGNRSVDVSTFGTNLSLDPSGGDNTIDGILGGTVAYKQKNGLEFYADGEAPSA